MECSRYRELLRATAKQLIAMSEGAPVRVESRGHNVGIGLPAAKSLLGEITEPAVFTEGWRTLADTGDVGPWAPARFSDTFGFSRPAYHPFLLHLFTRAGGESSAGLSGRFLQPALAATMTEHPLADADRLPLLLWWCVCAAQYGQREAPPRLVDRVLTNRGPDGALHPRGLDDLLDAWTFRELVAMHALGWLAILFERADWLERLREAAEHHQGHTQPDYTTYQPWGIFAFILADTPMFAEQQLHDAVTHAHVEGGGAGLVPAMILADAVAALEAAEKVL